MSNHRDEAQWEDYVDDNDDDFGELDKKYDNDQEIMKLTGISQSYYDVGDHMSPKEGQEILAPSPLSERSFNENDLNPVERSIEQPASSPRASSTLLTTESKMTSDEIHSEISWWERGVVGVVVVLGAMSVVALSRRK